LIMRNDLKSQIDRLARKKCYYGAVSHVRLCLCRIAHAFKMSMVFRGKEGPSRPSPPPQPQPNATPTVKTEPKCDMDRQVNTAE
jgi:hypothetical protein